MQIGDYISICALFISLISLISSYLGFKRNTTKLKIEQIQFFPNPHSEAILNKLF